MDSRMYNQTSATGHQVHRSPAIYRVVALHRNHTESLVTLADNSRQAAIFARAFCDTLNANSNRNGIVSVRTEEWVGTLAEGKWQPISRFDGGVSYRITTRHFAQGTRQPRSYHQGGSSPSVGPHQTKTDEDRNPSLPCTGDEVECVLLNEKTRKGGWRAKFLKRPSDGPITNTHQVPQSARPGQVVVLRVGAISQDGVHVQFHWRQGDNPE
jgi:hypothetical protein